MKNIFEDNVNEPIKAKKLNDMNPDIANARYYYDEFVFKMNKSSMANTSDRYITEITYVRQLKEIYEKHGYPGLAKEMEMRETEILKILKDDFYITLE